MSSSIIFAGFLVILGHTFKILAEKTKIPDVLMLFALGILLGPILSIISPENFGIMGNLISNITLSIILFYSGLEIDLKLANKSLALGTKTAILNFLFSIIIVSTISFFVFKINFIECLTIGTILGGTSFAIVIPMLKNMNLKPETKTVLLLESTISDVLSIIIAIGLFQMIKLNNSNPGFIIGNIISSFVMSGIIGSISAMAWSIALKWVRKLENDMLLTPAFIIIIFGLTDFLGYSGAIASLVFGIFLNNIKKIIEIPLFHKIKEYHPVEFNNTEVSIFSELVFILKIFFFFYIGISIRISSIYISFVGFFTILLIILLRFFISRFVTRKTDFSVFEKKALSIFAPRGLITVILISFAINENLIKSPLVEELVFSVLLFSIILTSFFSYMLEKNKLINLIDKFFLKTPSIEKI